MSLRPHPSNLLRWESPPDTRCRLGSCRCADAPTRYSRRLCNRCCSGRGPGPGLRPVPSVTNARHTRGRQCSRDRMRSSPPSSGTPERSSRRWTLQSI
uniref:Uncharacterized protein n=1 Tax=uncultured marine virus TaxID=186617 RepID=A0A0F7LAF7_9VIRU|nr:hypothetical protein [uncultured marine virus]